jgi:hypothetical protein
MRRAVAEEAWDDGEICLDVGVLLDEREKAEDDEAAEVEDCKGRRSHPGPITASCCCSLS